MTRQQRHRGYLASQEGIKRLKDAKFEKGYTSYESLAEAALVSTEQVKKLFNPHWGRPIEEEAIENIARVLGLQPIDIVGSKWYLLHPNLEPVQASGESLTSLSQTEPRTLKAKQELSVIQVPLASAFYVERPPIESQCYEVILEDGALIRIKAPQQMGKTWLVEKLLKKVEGYRTVNLSLKLADRIHFTDLDKFLRWFCTNISWELGLSSQLDDYWDEENRGSKVSCTAYLEEYLLQQADTPLVLCLDDVDWLFPYPEIYEDFFALLRSWHEKANSRKLWKRLRLVLIHSTEVYVRLNIEQSPFNVGTSVELEEFNQQQVQDLTKQYNFNWDTTQVEQLMNVIGGHPSLVQPALSHLKTHQDVTLDTLLETAPTESGIYGNHLRAHLLNLQQHPELAFAFKKVVTTMKSVRLETMQGYKLHSMGLVRIQGNKIEPRCNLYKQYFYDRLGDI